MNREQQIARAQTEQFDICIIGGGITGSGIAHHAVANGYKVLLLEREDFAYGTSSRSSKMIHGGLRYLKNFQLQLVHEALLERGHLLEMYPHLVKPIPYVLPSYGSKINLWVKNIGLSLYDALAGKSAIPPHRLLSAKEVLQHLPGLNAANLAGGIIYWDASTNDAKLVLEVISTVAQQSAVVLNYCGVVGFNRQEDSIQAIRCKDFVSGEIFEAKATVYVNAAGVWTDEVLGMLSASDTSVMKPSKGVHVVVATSKMPKDTVAIVASANGDGRLLYNLPWENNLTILGTTDTDFLHPPDTVNATQKDVDYILQSFNKSFPSAHLSYSDIIAVYAGLRPMLADEKSSNSYGRSREYKIWWNATNMLNIAGGKLTSFLSMGAHCLAIAKEKLNSPAKFEIPVVHSTATVWSLQYGKQGCFIDAIIQEDKAAAHKISDAYSYSVAEIIFFIRHQFAVTLDDILTRRTHITYAMKMWDETMVQTIAKIMAKELGKDNAWIHLQISNYRSRWQQYHPDFTYPN